jgi:hypothetical protein
MDAFLLPQAGLAPQAGLPLLLLFDLAEGCRLMADGPR